MKRSGQARLVSVFDINRSTPATWRLAREDLFRREAALFAKWDNRSRYILNKAQGTGYFCISPLVVHRFTDTVQTLFSLLDLPQLDHFWPLDWTPENLDANPPTSLIFWRFHSLYFHCTHTLIWSKIIFFMLCRQSGTLLCDIRSSSTISSFKSSLKSYLFQQSYWLCLFVGRGRERERKKTSGLLESVRGFTFFF